MDLLDDSDDNYVIKIAVPLCVVAVLLIIVGGVLLFRRVHNKEKAAAINAFELDFEEDVSISAADGRTTQDAMQATYAEDSEDMELNRQLAEAENEVNDMQMQIAKMQAEHDAKMANMTMAFVTKLQGGARTPQAGDAFFNVVKNASSKADVSLTSMKCGTFMKSVTEEPVAGGIYSDQPTQAKEQVQTDLVKNEPLDETAPDGTETARV